MVNNLIQLILQGLLETLIMVSASSFIGILMGIPLGMALFTTHPKGLSSRPMIYEILSFIINSFRSIPFIILIVLLIPAMRLIMGTSIGTWASIFPLSFAAILLISRVTEDVFLSLSSSLIEIGRSYGASTLSIFLHILLPEALPSLISSITTIIINLVGFSAMAGTVGGGGLGDLAIRYGYQRYDMLCMVLIVIILIALVQFIQMVGNYIGLKLRKIR